MKKDYYFILLNFLLLGFYLVSCTNEYTDEKIDLKTVNTNKAGTKFIEYLQKKAN